MEEETLCFDTQTKEQGPGEGKGTWPETNPYEGSKQ